MNCAVIFTYSFDSEVAVYLFEREEDAVKFLFDSYSEELRIARFRRTDCTRKSQRHSRMARTLPKCTSERFTAESECVRIL